MTEVHDDVCIALDLLREALDDKVTTMNQQGADAFARGDYATVDTVRKGIGAMSALRTQLTTLQHQSATTAAPEPTAPVTQPTMAAAKQPVLRKKHRRVIKPGLCTPVSVFMRAIPQALIYHGGIARAKNIIARLEQLMHDTLNDHDRSRTSFTHTIRWQNQAYLALRLAAAEGIVERNERGQYRITPKGSSLVTE